MSEMQDALNKILSNPEAMQQMKSLGEQLGLSGNMPQPKNETNELSQAVQSFAPLMTLAKPDGEVAALLTALKPFLSGEKLNRLNQAQKLLGFIKLIPLLKDSGMFL